jgi:hypothetical protein
MTVSRRANAAVKKFLRRRGVMQHRCTCSTFPDLRLVKIL